MIYQFLHTHTHTHTHTRTHKTTVCHFGIISIMYRNDGFIKRKQWQQRAWDEKQKRGNITREKNIHVSMTLYICKFRCDNIINHFVTIFRTLMSFFTTLDTKLTTNDQNDDSKL